MIATFRTTALMVLAVVVLAGCRNDEDANGAPDDTAALNAPPEIEGTPSSIAAVGVRYTFEPSAYDTDGDILTFEIANRPGWAAFNQITGKLTGMPPASSGRSYKDIRVSVTDGRSTVSLPAFDITIEGATATNAAPSISGTPATQVVVGHAYSFTPQASDADDDALTFSARGLPDWLAIDAMSGRVHGTPSSDAVGIHSGIVIEVSDGTTTVALPAFAIDVRTGNTNTVENTAPTIGGVPPLTVVAGQTYRFVPAAADPDDQALSFSIAGKPAWASFSQATGALSGTPSIAQAAVYDGITITVSDGTATATLPSFSITVLPANSAPKISGTPAASVTTGKAYAFQPSASDADGQALTFRISNKPSWATFSPSSGRLSGTPTSAGRYANIAITVTDGMAEATLGPFEIEVVAENRAPVISGSAPTTATAGVLYEFKPAAHDPDGDTLTFSIANKPAWASFNSTSGRVFGTPTASDLGTFAGVAITVSDGELEDDLTPFSITVGDASKGSATLSWDAPTTNEDGSPLTDLRGFRVYYGVDQTSLTSRLEIPSADVTSATIEALEPATWYFAVRAYTTDGAESGSSNVVSKTIN
jgi:hypothetical protein